MLTAASGYQTECSQTFSYNYRLPSRTGHSFSASPAIPLVPHFPQQPTPNLVPSPFPLLSPGAINHEQDWANIPLGGTQQSTGLSSEVQSGSSGVTAPPGQSWELLWAEILQGMQVLAAEHTRSALFAQAKAVLGLPSLESILGSAVTLRKYI